MISERKFGLIYFILGLVVLLTGYGMWRRPHLDWGTFVKDVGGLAEQIGSEAVHLTRDPLAALGVVVMLGGLVLVYEGFKRAFSERDGKKEGKREGEAGLRRQID